MTFVEWLLAPIVAQLNRIEGVITTMTASIDQVRADYKAYAQELKDQRDAALALAEQATAKAKENADALAAFVADDAATDLQQLADKEAQDAAAFQSDLDGLKAADEPVAPETPTEEPSAPVEEPPA